ncbi:MAG: nitrite reductase small subunit NirD [Alkalinema sp. RU_4_3]|nr:nitrite reductase small subunit NirD [Alkalinema sp. RU_4_3]
MLPTTTQQNITEWVTVCRLDRIPPNTGVCAMVSGQQVAVFHWQAGGLEGVSELYAIDNYDPFSKAYVLSRGIVGDRNGIPKVASPIYKQNFNLQTGECLDDAGVAIATYPSRITDGQVQIGLLT